MANDPKSLLRGLIQQISDHAREANPRTPTAEAWLDPRLWMAVDASEGDDKLLTMFMLGLMARDIELMADSGRPMDKVIDAFRRQSIARANGGKATAKLDDDQREFAREEYRKLKAADLTDSNAFTRIALKMVEKYGGQAEVSTATIRRAVKQ